MRLPIARPRSAGWFLLSFLFAYTLVFSGIVLAWSGPTATAPGNNVAAPVNIGGTTQVKSGSLGVADFLANSVTVGATPNASAITSPKYCIGSSCITAWPAGATTQWTTSGSNIYYNTGNVGIGVASPYYALQIYPGASATGGGMYISTSGADANGLNGIENSFSYTQSSSATRYPIADANSIHAKINAGVTNSGYVLGIDDTILRNYTAGDSGTLATLIGERIQYGNYDTDSSATPVNTAAVGLQINPLAYTGSSGTMYDLLLSGSSGNVGVGTHYGIYQSGSALDYFGGNVGIGTTNPAQKLEVNGNAQVDGNVSATAFLYTSDQSLKHDVQTIPDALSLVEKLRGVMFNWNSDDRPDMGVIAQEVQKVLPQLVHTDATTGLESVEYGNFIGIFIEAIKQVQGEITSLQQQNAQLQQQNAQLTGQVQSLEAQQATLDARVSALEAAEH